MQHRHIDAASAPWSVTAIASILERGGARSVIALLRELRVDPNGPIADAALLAAQHSDVYGYPELIRACLEEWRHARP